MTLEEIRAQAPEILAQVEKDAAQKERERIVALGAVDPLGLNAKKFAELKDKAVAEGWDKAALIVAIHEALAAQRKAEEEARQTQAKAYAEDGRALADLVGQIQPGTGDDKTDEEEARAKKEAKIAMEIAKQMTGGN